MYESWRKQQQDSTMTGEKWFLNVLRGVWGVLDVVVDIVVLALVLLFIVMILSLGPRVPHVPSSAALVINPQGELVEQFSGDPAQRALDRLLGRGTRTQTRLRDIIEAIHTAETDPRIKALVIDPDDMRSAALADLQAIGAAITEFKGSDKPVFAYADSLDQAQYYLATYADHIMLNPQGGVLLTGLGAYREYFKDALDKLGVDWNVFRVGKYKSYVEPFTRNDMSPAAKEADGALLATLWGSYQDHVVAARHFKAGAVDDYIAKLPDELAAAGGDMAQLALKQGLVDKLTTRDEMHAAIAKVAGAGPGGQGYNQVDFLDYLHATAAARADSGRSPDQVGVIVAEGDILDGNQPPGTIGGDSLSRLIREARDDKQVKALVLRVDSPGGSAFASELIRRQIELTKAAGKPVVVSMGAVAASGGYWISMAGDRIYASPTTITGSIGILGMFPTFQKTLAKIGIHNDGVGTTPLSGDFRPTRAMSSQAKKIFQLTIDHGYQEFVSKVANARHLGLDKVKQIAQGRVWSGADAKRLGLIDEFGELPDAIKAAAQLAGIAQNYSVHYIQPPLSLGARLLIGLSQQAEIAPAAPGSLRESPAARTLARLRGFVAGIGRFNDPNGIYAYCFCRLPL
jgi:protease-4